MERRFYTRNVASFHKGKSKLDLVFLQECSERRTCWVDPKVLEGMLVRDFLGNEGELDMLPLLCQTTALIVLLLMRWTFFDNAKSDQNLASATSNCLPSLIHLTFFLPFEWVHLDLQTLFILFFF